MGAHTEALCLTADSSSSDEELQRCVAYVYIKWKIQKKILTNKVCPSLRWTVAVFCCMNIWSISAKRFTVWRPTKLTPFARPVPTVRPSVRRLAVAMLTNCQLVYWLQCAVNLIVNVSSLVEDMAVRVS